MFSLFEQFVREHSRNPELTREAWEALNPLFEIAEQEDYKLVHLRDFDAGAAKEAYANFLDRDVTLRFISVAKLRHEPQPLRHGPFLCLVPETAIQKLAQELTPAVHVILANFLNKNLFEKLWKSFQENYGCLFHVSFSHYLGNNLRKLLLNFLGSAMTAKSEEVRRSFDVISLLPESLPAFVNDELFCIVD